MVAPCHASLVSHYRLDPAREVPLDGTQQSREHHPDEAQRSRTERRPSIVTVECEDRDRVGDLAAPKSSGSAAGASQSCHQIQLKDHDTLHTYSLPGIIMCVRNTLLSA